MGRNKTHEEFVNEIYQINKNIEIIGEYIDNKTKIMCRCKIDKNEWLSTPSNLLFGKGCKICGIKARSKKRTKSHEQFKNELFGINKNILLLSKYKHSGEYIKCKCLIDGHEWSVIAGSLLHGSGCPRCSKYKKMNTKDFENEIFRMYGDEYKLISEYVNIKQKVKILHTKCGNINETIPDLFLRGRRCPVCNLINRHAYTTETLKEKISSIYSSIEILGEYEGSMTPTLVGCKVCGNQWSVSPNELIYKKIKCPVCRYNTNKTKFDQKLIAINDVQRVGEFKNLSTKIDFRCSIHDVIFSAKPSQILNRSVVCPKCSKCPTITTETFKERVKCINENIDIIGEYISQKKKIKCKCKIHNYTWEAWPSVLDKGAGCPICRRTRGEASVAKYLADNNISYDLNKKYDDLRGVGGRKLSYDFYLPEKNILIEFQGKYHDGTVPLQTPEQFSVQQEHDKRKRNYALLKNIKLIEVWYYEIQNLRNILDEELLVESDVKIIELS